MDNTVGRLQSLFTPQQFDVVVGSLLGDARLECRSKGIRGPKTARFRVHHGYKQKDYVFWKYKVLKDFVSKGPRRITWHNKKRNLVEIAYYFHTKSFAEFGLLHGCFYSSRKKIIPCFLKENLNARSLAVWFMDDGCYAGSSYVLNTHCFEVEEQMYLSEIIKKKFGIVSTLVKDRHQIKLCIGSKYYRDFAEIIFPYITSSMNYKIVTPVTTCFV